MIGNINFPNDEQALHECAVVATEGLYDVLAISEEHKHLPVMLHVRRITMRAIEDVYQLAKKEDECS